MILLGSTVTVKKTHPSYNRLFENMTTQGKVVDLSSPRYCLFLVELERTKELRWFKLEHLTALEPEDE